MAFSETPSQWYPAEFFRREGAAVVCTLCPHACVLRREGETGFCRVRRRRGEGMETAMFASAVQHWDAVERKPLYHYYPGAAVLTLAAPGCTLRCDYCQNFRLSQYGREAQAAWQAQPASAQAVLAAMRAGGGRLVGLSYSEPGLAAEFSLQLGELARDQGAELVWKSNGYLETAAVRRLAGVLGAVNIDLKGVDPARHRALTGGDCRPVLDAIEAFAAAGVWVEVSTPLLPDLSGEELAAMARAIAAISRDIPWHLLRFVPEYRLQQQAPTPPAMIAEAMAAGRAEGLRYVYTERVLGDAGRETRCAHCGRLLLSRGLWCLQRNDLHEGCCPACRAPLPGRWGHA